MVYFGVKIFVFASQRSRIVFSRQVVATLFFFLQKQYILKPKVPTEYFFLPISETGFFSLNQICRQNFFSQKKT